MRSRHVRHDALHDRCVQRLRGLEIPRPFHLDVFAATVAEHRRRALHILPLPGLDGSDGLSGAWVATDTADYVLVDADASPWHRDLIGLHEISHVLCGHGAEDSGLGELAEDLLPCLSDVTIRRVLGRHGACGTVGEQEAELTAWLVLAELPEGIPAHAGRPFACLALVEALRSMRNELVAAVPGAAAGSWADAIAGPAGDPRIRLIRRIAEIRDAALALRGYVSPGTVAEARRLLAAPGSGGNSTRRRRGSVLAGTRHLRRAGGRACRGICACAAWRRHPAGRSPLAAAGRRSHALTARSDRRRTARTGRETVASHAPDH